MAATMKHKRSARRRRTTRGADRYDKTLTKFKRIKRYGGSALIVSKFSNKLVLAHRVSKDNPVYRGVKVMHTEE